MQHHHIHPRIFIFSVNNGHGKQLHASSTTRRNNATFCDDVNGAYDVTSGHVVTVRHSSRYDAKGSDELERFEVTGYDTNTNQQQHLRKSGNINCL